VEEKRRNASFSDPKRFLNLPLDEDKKSGLNSPFLGENHPAKML
jgi:hypothetical protein